MEGILQIHGVRAWDLSFSSLILGVGDLISIWT